MKYVTSDKIREIDNLAQTKFGIPSIVLMENAGRAASEEILKHLKANDRKNAVIFCGKGNNGGDGLVVARHLKCEGMNVEVALLGEIADVKRPDPLINLKIARKMGIKIIEIDDLRKVKKIRRRFNYDLIIDAIFGTGFSGRMPEHVATLIMFLNSTALPIISIDVPSGLNATNGKAEDIAIKAARTVTFGLPKTGFIKADGPKYTGEVIVRNITYPKNLIN